MIKIHYKKLYSYVCVILILYNTASIYNMIWPKADYPVDIFTSCFLFISITGITRKDINNILKYGLGISGVMFLITIVKIGFNNELIYLLAFSIKMLSVFIFVVWCYRNKISLLKTFAQVMFGCAIIYLIFYFIFDYGLLGVEGKKIFVDRNRFDKEETKFTMTNYFNIYFRWADKVKLLGISLIKANGPFSEAGQYQIYLNFAIIYYLFIDREKGKGIKLFVLSAAVISAASTMGLIILAALLIFNKMKNSKRYLVTWLLLLTIGSIIVGFILIEKFRVYGVYSRNENLTWAINILKNNFLLGTGYSNYYLSFYGLINYFIHFGLLGVYPVYIFIRGILSNVFGSGKKVKLALLIWWFGCMLNEPIGYTYFMCMVYAGCLIKKIYIEKAEDEYNYENGKSQRSIAVP